MPLKPPQPLPRTQRDWDQWARTVDITPSDGTVNTDSIVDDAVTNAKLRNSAALSVIGNPTGSPADPQDIAASSDGHYLRRSAGGLAFGAIADGDIPSTIARDTEVTAAIDAHKLEADPHPTYTTAAELATAISNHEAAADPHPGYTTTAELNAAIAALNLTSGSYTPTLTTVANISATTAYSCQYLRVGDMVHVSGRLDADPTAATTLTQIGISLPIASNFANSNECAGTANASHVDDSAAIAADTTNDRAQMSWICRDTTNHGMFFTFSYRVI